MRYRAQPWVPGTQERVRLSVLRHDRWYRYIKIEDGSACNLAGRVDLRDGSRAIVTDIDSCFMMIPTSFRGLVGVERVCTHRRDAAAGWRAGEGDREVAVDDKKGQNDPTRDEACHRKAATSRCCSKRSTKDCRLVRPGLALTVGNHSQLWSIFHGLRKDASGGYSQLESIPERPCHW